MTNKIVCNAEDLTAIADAVRASNGSTNTYNVPELSAAAVNAIGAGGSGVNIDDTLTIAGAAADAKAVGDKVKELTEEMKEQQTTLSNISIEGYERGGTYVSVVDIAEKHENAYLYRKYVSGVGYTAVPVDVANWNWYELPASEGEKYHLITWCGNQPAAIYMLDEAGAIVQFLPDPLQSGPEAFEGYFVIPAGVKTIRVNQQTQKTFVLERLGGQSLHFVRTEDAKVSEDHLYSKKLACVGDSITEATNPDGGYFTNYAEIAAARHNMTVYKDGKGGSTMTNVEGKNPFCVNRYQSVPADFDILTIWFGWNDNAYATVGTIDDTEDTTYYGAYKKVLDYFITTYPTKKIGLIVPYGNANVEKFRVAVRTLSEMYGVPCLDLADGKQCSLLWGTANAAQEARRAALTYDGTHPNQVGHEYLSTMYEEFIKRL
jgi:lysophospholipase L1-like esterase